MKENNYLIECVPNISEGRDPQVIERIANYIQTPEVKLLNVDIGYDANRTVLTLIGTIEAVFIAIKKLYQISVNIIDMSKHYGAHPRLGTVDVCPFIPFDLKDKDDLKNRVESLAKEISNAFKMPVFLYAESSLKELNKTIPKIRKGEYEELINENSSMREKADFGAAYLNRMTGGTIMGVRDFMIAYNVNIETSDLKVAKSIAKEMRGKREEVGEFNGKNIRPMQILGWYIDEYQCCQISTNIHNPRDLSMTDVFSFTTAVCHKHGIKVTSSEIIGMIPSFAKKLAEQDLIKQQIDSSLIDYLGLDFKAGFKWSEKIIPNQIIQ